MSVVLKPCRWACRPTSLMVSPCRITCTIVLCISSGTNDLWPHPLHFYFHFLFFFVSYYLDSYSKTHNHLCACSNHPEILNCVSSVLLLNVHTWINVCCLSSYCVFYVFWMRTWLNLCKMMAFLCRVLQKTLIKLEHVCKQVKCVKSFEKHGFVSRTVWVVWKIGTN